MKKRGRSRGYFGAISRVTWKCLDATEHGDIIFNYQGAVLEVIEPAISITGRDPIRHSHWPIYLRENS